MFGRHDRHSFFAYRGGSAALKFEVYYHYKYFWAIVDLGIAPSLKSFTLDRKGISQK